MYKGCVGQYAVYSFLQTYTVYCSPVFLPFNDVFLTQENEAAKGINNYLLTRTDLDLENFAIFSINSDITSIALVTQASDEPTASILRGLIPYGSDDTGRVAADIAYGLLSGEKEAPYWIFDELHTINTFGWTLDMAPAR